MVGLTSRAYHGDPEQAARRFLGEYGELFRIKPGAPDLDLAGITTLKGIDHIRFRQTYAGLPVIDAEFLVHRRSDGRIDMVNGNYYPDISVDVIPAVPEQEAIQQAINAIEGRWYLERRPEASLQILPGKQEFTLVWNVRLLTEGETYGSWEVLVDARTGKVVRKTNLVTSFVPGSKARSVRTSRTEAADVNLFDSDTPSLHPTMTIGSGRVYPTHPGLSSPIITNLYRLSGNGILEGTYANVHDNDGPRASSSTHYFVYDPQSDDQEETNLYYHVDTYRAGYLADLGFNRKIGSDYDMEAYTDFYFDDDPNAAWDPARERIRCCPYSGVNNRRGAAS